jgi:hypothetical protein
LSLEDATKLSRVQRSLKGCDRWGEERGPLERYSTLTARARA